MATTAVEDSRTRSRLARVAGTWALSPVSVLAGVLVGYAAFALLFGITVAVLHHNHSSLDLTRGWEAFGTRGGLLLGGLLFLAYLLAGYVAGRMAGRRGVLHGVVLFVAGVAIVGVVAVAIRSLAKPKDVKEVTDTLRSFGVPTRSTSGPTPRPPTPTTRRSRRSGERCRSRARRQEKQG